MVEALIMAFFSLYFSGRRNRPQTSHKRFVARNWSIWGRSVWYQPNNYYTRLVGQIQFLVEHFSPVCIAAEDKTIMWSRRSELLLKIVFFLLRRKHALLFSSQLGIVRTANPNTWHPLHVVKCWTRGRHFCAEYWLVHCDVVMSVLNLRLNYLLYLFAVRRTSDGTGTDYSLKLHRNCRANGTRRVEKQMIQTTLKHNKTKIFVENWRLGVPEELGGIVVVIYGSKAGKLGKLFHFKVTCVTL